MRRGDKSEQCVGCGKAACIACDSCQAPSCGQCLRHMGRRNPTQAHMADHTESTDRARGRARPGEGQQPPRPRTRVRRNSLELSDTFEGSLFDIAAAAQAPSAPKKKNRKTAAKQSRARTTTMQARPTKARDNAGRWVKNDELERGFPEDPGGWGETKPQKKNRRSRFGQKLVPSMVNEKASRV